MKNKFTKNEIEGQSQVINITLGYLKIRGFSIYEIEDYSDYLYKKLEGL